VCWNDVKYGKLSMLEDLIEGRKILSWCRSWNLFVLACTSYLLIPRYAQYSLEHCAE